MSTEIERVNAEALAMRERHLYAQELAKARSPLLPSAFRGSPGDLLLVMEYGRSLDLPIAQIFTDVHLVNGKPGMSAKLMHALMLRAGHKVRVFTAADGKSATCRIIRHDDPEPFEETFTLGDAIQAGLCTIDNRGRVRARDTKDQPTPWERYTRVMLRNRAISAAARAHCPDVLAGVAYTPDELEDSDHPGIVDGYSGVVVDAEEPVQATQDETQAVAQENEATWRTEWFDRLAAAVQERDLTGIADLGKDAAAHGHSDLIDTAKAAWRRVRVGETAPDDGPAADDMGGADPDTDAEIVEDGDDQ